MKKKFPIILILIFSIFALTKITFFYLYVDSVRENSQKFNKVIGDLRYYLKPYEENTIKFKFVSLLRTLDSTKAKYQEDEKKNQENDEKANANIYEDKKILKKAVSLNNALNKYTKKYIFEDDTKPENKIDINKEKTVEDDYIDFQDTKKDIQWDDEKLKVQQKQMKSLKDILSKEDFDQLSNIIKDMNTNSTFENVDIHQSILSILSKYDLDSYLILGQLTGRFKILAYYELLPSTGVTRKNLKAIQTDELSKQDDEKYKSLVNSELTLLDVLYSKYFKGFFIFTDGEKGQLSLASDFQNKTRGYLGIDPADFSSGIKNDFEKSRFYHCIINELSKVIILSNNQIDYSKADALKDMDNFDSIRDSSKKDSYLLQFYIRFWDDLLYLDSRVSNLSSDENARKYFYLRHNREFLNQYVAQDPFKDIIESLTIFLLENKPVGPEEKFQKIRFFFEFPELNDIKKRLTLNIKHMEE